MIIPSGKGKNGDLSISIILLKKMKHHLTYISFGSISLNIKQAVFPQS